MAIDRTPVALTIAGSDPSGGAGLQADLKTFSALGVYGCAVVSALTAQNTRGVRAVWPVPAGSVAEQIAAVLDDVPVAAVKLGMLFNRQVVGEVSGELRKHPGLPVVCDPVMVASSGDRLYSDSVVNARRHGRWSRRLRLYSDTVVNALIEQIIPLAALITPNTAEAAALLNVPEAKCENAMREQAEQLLALGSRAVLLKGGHLRGDRASDVFVWREADALRCEILHSPRIATKNTHGTGCTLAAAIAAGLARGESLAVAVGKAKLFVSQAIAHADELAIGAGAGPVNHLFGNSE
jgi:hydroxymethylpyrimidine/phosphomethylpyrimidine kinase